jgi:non-specific serine/threonine protein kinase
VASLCRRLDGIPLAIELAAARLRSLSVNELEHRLNQRFRILTGGSRTALPRQQTLRALIDWSFDLLNAEEKTVFARLAAFVGGWDLTAAEDVVSGGSIESWEVLDHLAALVDKSLVQTDTVGGSTRYRLLESVRDYAAEQLARLGEDEAAATRRAHRDHYLALAEEAAPYLTGGEQLAWLDRLELEHDNLRAALAATSTEPDPSLGLRAGVALRWFWWVRAYFAEGAEFLGLLLRDPEAVDPGLRGRALVTAAEMLLNLADYEPATARAQEALLLAESQDDDWLQADATSVLVQLRSRQADLDGAAAYASRSVRHARATGDEWLLAYSLINEATMRVWEGAVAIREFEKAIAILRNIGDGVQTGRALNNLANTELQEREFGAAHAHFSEIVEMARDLGSGRMIPVAIFNLGLVEAVTGHLDAARGRFVESLVLARRSGDRSQVAYTLLGFALLAGYEGEHERAATLHGALAVLLEELGESLQALEEGYRDEGVARQRAVLGDRAFELAYEAGRSLGRDAAIALALASR